MSPLGKTASILAALALSACSSISPAHNDTVVVDVPWERLANANTTPSELTGTIELSVGQTALVDFGNTNSSVGDSWALQDGHDTTILTAAAVNSAYEKQNPPPGSQAKTSATLKALAPGTTIVSYQYSYRARPLISYKLTVHVN
jgi:hypothetical protein